MNIKILYRFLSFLALLWQAIISVPLMRVRQAITAPWAIPFRLAIWVGNLITSVRLFVLDQLRLTRAGLACGVAVIAMLFVFAPRAQADSQGYPSTIISLTNFPNSFTNATATQPILAGGTNTWTNSIPLHVNAGLGVEEVFQASNLMTGPVTTWFYPTVDGTNYFTNPWATLAISANGTNTVIGGTNWDWMRLRGFLALSVVISNGTGNGGLVGFGASDMLTNVTPTYTNIQPGGLNFNRPNQ